MGDVVVKPGAGVVSCELSDGAALLDTRSNVYYGLNPTGFKVWTAIGASSSKEALIELLMATYGLDRATSEADLDRILADLKAADLVEVSGPSEA